MCTACQIAVLPKEVPNHFRNAHFSAHISVDRDILTTASEIFNLVAEFPAMDNGPYPEIVGLKVHQGLKCGSCSDVYGTQTSMSKHYRAQHKGVAIPPQYAAVQMHRFDNGKHKSYFPIMANGELSLEPTEQIIQDLRDLVDAMWAIDDGEMEFDARQVTPWLRTTKWHEHVQPFKTEDLRRLVSFPGKEEFPGLKEAVHSLLQHAMGVISKIPELALQRLNSADPIKK